MTIIGICGFAGSGKDTVGKFFIDLGYKRLSFASTLKDVCSNIFGWDREMLEGLTEESRKEREIVDDWWSKKLGIKDFSPRLALKLIGTDIMRDNFNKDIWLLSIEQRLTKNKNVVITDCRFKNEIEMIQRMGGVIVFVDRNKPNWYKSYRRGEDTEESNKVHISEKEWTRTDYDYKIKNNSTLEELETRVVDIASYI